MENICFNCFKDTGGYEVCPYCGNIAGTANAPAFMLQPGMRIWGRYLIGTILGTGGFGVTYRAFDTRLGTIVAIKEFFPQNLASRMPNDTELRIFSGEEYKNFLIHKQRFVDEGKNLAKFTGDAHIVNVLDSFEDNNTAYIVMEFLDGMTLKEYMAQSGSFLPQDRAVQIMEALLLGIKSIHLKGIIHRDISPDNIYVLQDGNIKILDFGAARFAAREDWTQSVVVKKGYAPPEQYRNNMRQTEQTDLYAAGATLYKMLTGKTPEESIERTERDVLLRPSKIADGIDAHLDKMIMKSVALRPELRFKSADAMLEALRGGTGYDYPEEELKKIKRRKGALVALAIVMVVSVLGIMSWRFANGESVMPEIIVMQTTLADLDIKPDSIELWVSEYENEDGVYDILIEEFSKTYPEYVINLNIYNDDDYYMVSDNRDAQEVEADLFSGWFAERADLSPLIHGLNRDDYYGSWVHEHFDRESISFVDVGMYLNVLSTIDSEIYNEGYIVPASINSMDEIIEYSDNVPLNIESFLEATMFYYPELVEDAVYDPQIVEPYFRSYMKGMVEKSFETIYSYLQTNYIQGSSSYSQGYNSTNEISLVPMIKSHEGTEYVFGSFSNSFTVNTHSDENKQLVAMQFLHFMLSEKGQSILNVQMESYSLPVNKAAMQEKMEFYPELIPLEKYMDYPFGDFNYAYYDMQDEFRELFSVYYEGVSSLFEYEEVNEIAAGNYDESDVDAIVDKAVEDFLNYEYTEKEY